MLELWKIDEDEELKAIAATPLGQMGTVAIAALCELLLDEDTRVLAVRSLCCIRQPETIAPLLSVIQDPQAAIRAAAIEADRNIQPQRLLTLKVRFSCIRKTTCDRGTEKAEQWKIHCVRFAPNCPEQNPIEDIWLQAKTWVRRFCALLPKFSHLKWMFEWFIRHTTFDFPTLQMYGVFSKIK